MRYLQKKTFKKHSVFIWLFIVTILAIALSKINTISNNEKINQINNSLENIYLRKTIKEITNNLKPRYLTIHYVSKTGDTYQSIINKLNINKKEKKILLENILKEKSLKILKINQKFTFKFDDLSKKKLLNLKLKQTKKTKFYSLKLMIKISLYQNK